MLRATLAMQDLHPDLRADVEDTILRREREAKGESGVGGKGAGTKKPWKG